MSPLFYTNIKVAKCRTNCNLQGQRPGLKRRERMEKKEDEYYGREKMEWKKEKKVSVHCYCNKLSPSSSPVPSRGNSIQETKFQQYRFSNEWKGGEEAPNLVERL